MQRIPFQKLYDECHRVLITTGFTPDRADVCARVFAENTRDGVHSHGLNRFPQFIERAKEGRHIDIHAMPKKADGFGLVERWDGCLGPGIPNATFCMDRAISLAREYGIGCVALKNTNHWMRAGTYGLQAADAGCIGICWTNTTKLMPPWGSAERKVGNNPLVIAIPRPGGHILLDMAISQFSGGKMEIYRRNGEPLPVKGGYDTHGNLTCDAVAIHESGRSLPIGCWKGSGLALTLDLVVTLLSGGRSTYQLAKEKDEYGVSQIFIAIDVTTLVGEQVLHQTVGEIIDDLHDASPLAGHEKVTYPGERMLQTRKENLTHGIPVNTDYWQQVLDM